ncbi:MAG: hypothetical protein KAT25_02855 [Sulfuriflexus sp.]|nr:hypothetical protein [Sulfuriflexus sp.]
MNDEKRIGDKPIPDHTDSYLNAAQQSGLHKIESFGWDIKYIRHPLFQEPVVFVSSADGKSIGILEDDGRLNLEFDIETRE